MQAPSANYQPIVGTKSQQSFSLFHSAIWRPVQKEALSSRVLTLRNILIVLSVTLLAMDAFDTFLLKEWTCKETNSCAGCTKAEIAGTGTADRVAICKKSSMLTFQGIIRDWLFICYTGSITSLLGSLWLSKELIMVGAAISFTVLPWLTPAIIYLRYPTGALFDTWWYFTVTVLQFTAGCLLIALYANLKKDLDQREREEELKKDMGVLKFEREPFAINCQPCGCRIADAQMTEVIKRYNQSYDVNVRANILCPNCKNRVTFLSE